MTTTPKPTKPTPPKDGYYRTVENVVVYRTYSATDGVSYSQSVAQGPGGELPEGVTNKDIINE